MSVLIASHEIHHTKMNFRRSIKTYVQFFYGVGLSPYRAGLQTRSKKLSCSDITNIVWFILCLYLFITYFLENMRTADVISKTSDFVYYLDLLFEIIRAASVFLQCMIRKQTFYDINFTFQEIESYFYTRLQHRVSYQSFRRRFNLKALIIILAYSQYLVGHIIRLTRGYVSSQMRILQALTVLTYIHIIFYIEALSYHLDQLNVVIKKDMLQCNSSSLSRATNNLRFQNQLKSLKWIHFRLWLVAQHINRAFGSILITLTLYSFMDLVVCAYWFYEEIEDRADVYKLFRRLKKIVWHHMIPLIITCFRSDITFINCCCLYGGFSSL